MRQAYAEDLAYIHDAGFSDFVLEAMPGLLRILRKKGVCEGLVVDLGCGSGTWARELCNRGYRVLGIDISPAMIRLAEKNAPKARFRAGSFLRTKLPLCNAVTAVGEVLNYQFDNQKHQRGLSNFFRRVYSALSPGGLFVFDIATPGRAGRAGFSEGFSSGRDWAILFRAEEDKRRRLLIREISTFRQVGKHYRRAQEMHCLRLYPVAAIDCMLQEVGFRVELRGGYGKQQLPPGLKVFVAQRPGQ